MACSLWFFAFEAKGSHIAAMDISYKGIDTFQYVVSVKIYRDCRAPASLFPEITVSLSSSNCAGNTFNSILPLITGDGSGDTATGNFIPLPCLDIDACHISNNKYSVEEFVYMDTITLPLVCSDWIISYETLGLRNTNDVLQNSSTHTIYVSAMLNNLDAPGNNSPEFQKPPVAIFCQDRDFYFNQGATEIDGDSLVYSLAQAQGSSGLVLNYNLGYDYLTPFPVLTPPLTIDSETGLLSFTPIAPAITSVLCVQVEEYNVMGNLIASIKNDMQVEIRNDCESDTLNFIGDTTVSTGFHPAISAQCLDNVIVLHFDNLLQCETIDLDASDFVIVAPDGSVVQIDSIASPQCLGGLIDSLVLYLSDSLRYNGSYMIYDTIGTDLIPVLSECGLKLNDTLELRLRSCVKASVDLINVTVQNNDRVLVYWNTETDNFKEEYFLKYVVSRSLFPNTGYSVIDSMLALDDSVYLDQNASVLDNPYNYMVEMNLLPSLSLVPISDSIQSVLLTYSQTSPDTNIIDLFWTPYWGWDSPSYELVQSINNGPWEVFYATVGTNLSHTYTKSLLASNYRVMVRIINPDNEILSYSNWVDLDVVHKQVPNIITPNNDGINDRFFINERLIYGGVHLIVYSRWGAKVYEDENYENDWNGDNFFGKPLSEGTYYYVLKFGDGKEMSGHLSILREGK